MCQKLEGFPLTKTREADQTKFSMMSYTLKHSFFLTSVGSWTFLFLHQHKTPLH